MLENFSSAGASLRTQLGACSAPQASKTTGRWLAASSSRTPLGATPALGLLGLRLRFCELCCIPFFHNIHTVPGYKKSWTICEGHDPPAFDLYYHLRSDFTCSPDEPYLRKLVRIDRYRITAFCSFIAKSVTRGTLK